MIPKSMPGRIVQAWRNAHFDLVLCEPMLDEIARVLAYPKIRTRLHWNEERINNFILLLRFKADVVDIKDVKVDVPADEADIPVLATMIAGQAEYLVTGDTDLLALRDDYPIATPAEFAQRL